MMMACEYESSREMRGNGSSVKQSGSTAAADQRTTALRCEVAALTTKQGTA